MNMSRSMKCVVLQLCAAALCSVALPAWSQTAAAPASEAPAAAAAPLFAVEIKTGPAWDSSKAPQDQAHFRDHSANLRRLREAGALLMGARYSDKGLVVLRAANEAEARAMMDADPAVQARVFVYELFPFNVFYAGTLVAPARRP
jgi:uncharacterized protein YciI